MNRRHEDVTDRRTSKTFSVSSHEIIMEELVMESGPLDPLSIEQDGVNGAGEAIALATSQSLLVRMVTFGCEFAMMVGGVVPYVPQYICLLYTS